MIKISEEFSRQLTGSVKGLRGQLLRTVLLLTNNPAHPGLHAHKLHAVDKWECYVNRSYRLIYDRTDDGLRLWSFGPHSIIDHLSTAAFTKPPHFSPWEVELPSERLTPGQAPGYVVSCPA